MKVLVLIATLFAGCTNGSAAKPDPSHEASAGSDESSGSGAAAAGDDLTVTQPVAMQLLCAPFAPGVSVATQGRDIVGCIVRDAAGRRIPNVLSSLKVEASLPDGKKITPVGRLA